MKQCLNCGRKMNHGYFCEIKCEMEYCEKMNEEQMLCTDTYTLQLI
jgi:hypothetical protein